MLEVLQPSGSQVFIYQIRDWPTKFPLRSLRCRILWLLWGSWVKLEAIWLLTLLMVFSKIRVRFLAELMSGHWNALGSSVDKPSHLGSVNVWALVSCSTSLLRHWYEVLESRNMVFQPITTSLTLLGEKGQLVKTPDVLHDSYFSCPPK